MLWSSCLRRERGGTVARTSEVGLLYPDHVSSDRVKISDSYNDELISLSRARLSAFSSIRRIARWVLTSLYEAPND